MSKPNKSPETVIAPDLYGEEREIELIPKRNVLGRITANLSILINDKMADHYFRPSENSSDDEISNANSQIYAEKSWGLRQRLGKDPEPHSPNYGG